MRKGFDRGNRPQIPEQKQQMTGLRVAIPVGYRGIAPFFAGRAADISDPMHGGHA